MKNNLFVIAVVLLTVLLGTFAYLWYTYLREVPVVVNDDQVETVDSKDVVVEEATVQSDIDENIEAIEKEVDAIDVDKELGDFNDLNW